MTKLLEIDNLEVAFRTSQGRTQAVRGVSFEMEKGECVALVGESGCGKSVTAQSILQLVPQPPAEIRATGLRLQGKDLLSCSSREMRRVRGQEVGIIFQDPLTALNPLMTVGRQVVEALRSEGLSKRGARLRGIELLNEVGIPDPGRRFDQFPHELSGGMRQRVMIAMALACRPSLLIADEPTTALDVTVQAQILDLLLELQERLHMSILLITHDLGVVARVCSRVIVMYAGKIVEEGPVDQIFSEARHPYTQALLHAVPRLGAKTDSDLAAIPGAPPDLRQEIHGCAFAPRCPHTMKICVEEQPSLGKPRSACWLCHRENLA